MIESLEEHKGEKLHKCLSSGGFQSSIILPEGTRVERLYLLVFAMQMAAINAARRAGRDAPYFLSAKKKLGISDEMIY